MSVAVALVRVAVPAVALSLGLAAPAAWGGMEMEMKAHGAAAAAPGAPRPDGTLVRESSVEGYRLAYRLYGWEERNALMKDMMGMTMAGMNEGGTHHLMVFITGPDGRTAAGAKVGFLVTGPDGDQQKTLTMAMYDGYGADLVLRGKGAYRIRLKADVGGTVLGEEFIHEVK